MSALEEIGKLKVAELRSELQSRGLDSKGVKAVLFDRLKEAIESEEVDQKGVVGEGETATADEVVPKESSNVEEKDDEEKEEAEEEPIEKSAPEEKEEEPVENNEVESNGHDEETAEESMKEETQVDEEKKEEFEDAPMEDLTEVKSEVKVEDILETEGEDILATEGEEKLATEDEGNTTEVKSEETSDVKVEDSEEKRGTKRSNDQQLQGNNKRYRQDHEDFIRVEDEPEIDKTVVALDWYNCDLSLVLDKDTRLTATPIVVGGFAYVWHGVRSLYGSKTGKLCFEVKIEDHLAVQIEEEEAHPHVVRVGWSVDSENLTLGESCNSYGYGGTGKASTGLKFKDYGKTYGKGDVIGCFMDFDSSPMEMSFTVNGEHQGSCYEITGDELKDNSLFPHILTKNCSFKVNFGSEDPWFEPLTGYTFIGKVPVDDLFMGLQGPEKREDGEIIMMVGLPGAGKTTWAVKHVQANPDKKYNILGTNNLIDRMKVMGLPRKRNYHGRWDQLIEKCTKCLNKLLYIATKRRRNFILDQTNVYPTAQKRKMKGFTGYKRRAVVVFPTDEDLKARTEKRESEEGKEVPDRAILEMKANFKLPEVGDSFDEIEFIEMDKDAAKELLVTYNKEGEKAGFGPKTHFSGGGYQKHGGGQRVGYVDKRGKYNNRGGGGGGAGGGGSYRGGWDRDRDRRGGFDRREQRGGWNRDRNQRGGAGSGGGFNRDRRGAGGGGWGGSGYKGSQNTWSQGSGNQSYNNPSWGSQQGYNQSWGGQGGYNQGYNWNQQYYGQNQQTQQQYWNQGSTGNNQYGNQTGYGSGYNAGSSNYNQQQQQLGGGTQQQQWGTYGQQQNYTGSTGTTSSGYQNNSYTRK